MISVMAVRNGPLFCIHIKLNYAPKGVRYVSLEGTLVN